MVITSITVFSRTDLFFKFNFFFKKMFEEHLTFLKKCLRNTIRVLNSLDPDQALRPDLGPICLQTALAGKDYEEGYLEVSEITYNFLLLLFVKLDMVI